MPTGNVKSHRSGTMASDVISKVTQNVISRSIQRLVVKPQRLKRNGQKLINETLTENIKRKKYQVILLN